MPFAIIEKDPKRPCEKDPGATPLQLGFPDQPGQFIPPQTPELSLLPALPAGS